MIRDYLRGVQRACCLFAAVFAANSACAQSADGVITAPERSEVSLSNATEEEIRSRFGEPDAVEPERTGATWRYGRSQVFFSDGVVSGWLDSGDLAERQFSAALKSKRKPGDPFEGALPKKGWKNDWQPAEGVAPEDIVDSLMEPERAGSN
jgi:hypothetical protein